MNKDGITICQGQYLLTLFLLGSALAYGGNANVGNDIWISALMSLLITIPLVSILARIMKLYPGMDLFEILEALFGKVGGKILTALMTWYGIHFCSLVWRHFSEFIQVSVMPETPQLPVLILMFAITAYLAKSGLKAMAKWSVPMLVFVVFMLGITIFIGLGRMRFSNMLPMFSHSIGLLSQGALQLSSLPFAELVMFLYVAKGFPKGESPYKLFLIPAIFSTAIIFLIIVRNLTLLGSAMMSIEYFPSYAAVRIIEIEDFLTRNEGIVLLNFTISIIAKSSLILLAATRGVASLLNIKNSNILIVPVGLLIIALGSIEFKSLMEMTGFINYYWIYESPFQVAIPLLVWITAEFKKRKPRNSALSAAGNPVAGD